MTLTSALRKIVEREFARLDAATEHERAIPIITADVIPIAQLNPKRGERLVPHPGNVKVTFALAIKILLAQIAVPALEDDREQTQFILFAERGHVGSGNGLSKRANTQLSNNAQQSVLAGRASAHSPLLRDAARSFGRAEARPSE